MFIVLALYFSFSFLLLLTLFAEFSIGILNIENSLVTTLLFLYYLSLSLVTYVKVD